MGLTSKVELHAKAISLEMTVKTKARKRPKAKRKEKSCRRCKNIHLESVAEKGSSEKSIFLAKGKKFMIFSK